MTDPKQLLATTDLLLLDFDGPVTRLLPPPTNSDLADQLRDYSLNLGVFLTPDEMNTADHLSIIRAAGRQDPNTLLAVEALATRLEVFAASRSPLTLGTRELLKICKNHERSVVIVTNNSPACVNAFLARHNLEPFVQSVCGRDPLHIGYMKPHSHMLVSALRQYPHHHAVMIGDSTSDILAANHAGIPSIGLAKNMRRSRELINAGANAVVYSIPELQTPTGQP